jgi:hypothetical protein
VRQLVRAPRPDEQCCGSELIFLDSDPHIFLFGLGFGSLYYYFDTKLLKMVPLIAFMFVLESVRQRKMFSNWKLFFSFKCLIFAFSQIFLNFTTVPGSELKSELFYGFGSRKNIRILSNSDPQHCWSARYRGERLLNFLWIFKSRSDSNKTGLKMQTDTFAGHDQRGLVKK